MFKCSMCEKEFVKRQALANHEKSHNNTGFKCNICGYFTKLSFNFNRHLESVHQLETQHKRLPSSKGGPLSKKKAKLEQPAKVEEIGTAYEPDKVKVEDILTVYNPAKVKPEIGSIKLEKSELPTKYPETHLPEQQIDNIAASGNLNKSSAEVIDLASSDDDMEEHHLKMSELVDNLPHPDVLQYYGTKMLRDYEHSFKTRFLDLQLKFKDLDEQILPQQVTILRKVIENMVAVLTTKVPKYHKVRFVMQSDVFHAPISHPFVLQEQFTADMIFDSIKRVLNSAEEFRLSSGVTMNFIHQPMPKPSAGWNHLGMPAKRSVPDKQQYNKMKRSLINIKNKDQLCVARSLMVGKKIADGEYHKSYNNSAGLRKDSCQVHTICEVPEGPCSLEQIKAFADNDYFADYMINVFNAMQLYARIYSTDVKEKKINILLNDGHCSVIRSVPGFFNSSYWCADCGKCYKNKPHKCLFGCPHCHHKECANTKKLDHIRDVLFCNDCKSKFFTQECLDNHKELKECKNKVRCQKCNTLMSNKKMQADGVHPNCGLKYCRVCKKYVDPENHEFCYVQPYQPKEGTPDCASTNAEIAAVDLLGGDKDPEELEKELAAAEEQEEKESEKKSVVYYYDMETEFADTNIHHVVLVHCQKEDGQSHEFYGDNAVDLFMQWVLNEKPSYWRILIAHNARSFDAYPVMRYFYNNSLAPSLIMDGQKVLQIRYTPNKLIFRDSLMFLPFKLEDFTKAFALEAEKTHFPYQFNVKANRDYEGPLPELKYYDPNSKSPQRKQELVQWWNAENQHLKSHGETFNLQKVLKEYCKNDVTLLREGCEKYRKATFDRMGIDPLVSAITGASAVHLAYRKNYLCPESIAVVSDHGLQPETHYSMVALAWLSWLMKVNGVTINCALNGKEKRIGKYRIDGFLVTDKGQKPLQLSYPWATGMLIFEFNGCLFHGHTCMDDSKRNPFTNETMKQCRIKTMERKKALESQGYIVIEKYECQFRAEIDANDDLKDHVKSMGGLKEPLKPRKGFFGGRTNAIKLLYEAGGREEIKYYDFTSLYPNVNMYRDYPVGPPEIIKYNFRDIRSYFGICQVTVLPPRDLFMPILPMRTSDGKLMFTLCAKCAEIQAKTPTCCHDVCERVLKNQVYCTPELFKALDMGYKIIAIDEIWHWNKRDDKMFRGFLLKWTEVKICSSGFPKGCESTEDQQAYVDEQNAAYELNIKIDDVSKNPTMRTLAKQNLNQFWGRYGMQLNKRQTKIATTVEELMTLFSNPNLEIHDTVDLNDSLMLITYSNKEQNIPVQSNLSLVIALFTTCWARLHLYEQALGILQPEQILYMDTDSIIWVKKPGYPELRTGDKYGDFKDEILDQYGPGSKITKFFAGGPKSYGYKVENSDGSVLHTCKVKGIPFSTHTLEQFDAEKMLEIVTALDGQMVEIKVPWEIHRDRKTATLFNRPATKRWRVVYTKRAIIDETYETLPFGYYEGAADDIDCYFSD